MTAFRSRPAFLVAGLVTIAIMMVTGVAWIGRAPSASEVASPPREGPELDPVPWSAVEWRAVPNLLGRAAVVGLDRIDGLIRGGPGIVGWGWVSQPGRNQFNAMGAIYLSANGEGWQVVRLDAGVGPADASEPARVADGPAGLLVLGGVCCEQELPAAWRSPDGLGWERLAPPEPLVAGQLVDLVGTEERYVIAVTEGDVPGIWTSADGIAWDEVDPTRAGFGKGGISDLSLVPGGLRATGWLEVGETYDGSVWTSQDGLSWSPVALGPMFSGELDTVLGTSVAWDRGWWVTGNEGPHADRVQCEQLTRRASLEGVSLPEPPRPNLSCGWGLETHWLSADGLRWDRRVPFVNGQEPPPGTLVEFRFVEAGGPGLIAFGEGYGESRPSLFASGDGRSWSQLPELGGIPAATAASGFVRDGRRLVAVTDGPTIWIGTVR
jgi:hypothetical protein